MRRNPAYVLCLLLLLLVAGLNSASGQSRDFINLISFDYNQFPEIPFEFEVYCDSVKQTSYDAIRLYEDGVLKYIAVTCASRPYLGDVGIILDRSGSQETRLRGIKEGLFIFYEYYKGTSFLSSFAEFTTIDQRETKNKNAILDTLNRLMSHGTTALWEGVITTLDSCFISVKEAVIITDGEIVDGRNLAFQAVKQAKLRGIKLHVLSLGSVPPIRDTLKMVAQQTGGRFMYIPSGFYPNSIVGALGYLLDGKVMQDICTYKFRTSCADGQRREVVIEVDVCGKTIRYVTAYFAKLDVSGPSVKLKISDDTLYYGHSSLIPVVLADIWEPNNITGLQLTIAVPDFLRVVGIVTDGCLLEGRRDVNMEYNFPNVLVSVFGEIPIKPVATVLFYLELAVADTMKNMTSAEIDFLHYGMHLEFCTLYWKQPGMLTALKKGVPSLTCEADTVRVKWNKEESVYEPAEFDLRVGISNRAPIPIGNPFVRVSFPDGLELVNGPAERPLVTNPLLAGEYMTFRFRALPATVLSTYEICVEAGGDSTDIIRCCTPVSVEPAKPNLAFWCEIPDSVHWNPARAAYEPEDFPVTVFIANKGKVPAMNITISIDVPDWCMLRSTYPWTLSIKPNILAPGDTVRYVWKVLPLGRDQDEMAEFITRANVTGDEYTSVCDIFLPQSAGRTDMVCVNGKSIYFNDTTKEYSPELIAISAEITNTSRLPMYMVMGRLIVPPFLHFEPGEGPVKELNTDPLWPGITRQMVWILHAEGEPTPDAEVCMYITAPYFAGDSCCVPIRIRNTYQSMPELVCALSGPDTIRFTDGGYVPDPFTLNVSIRNEGDTLASKVYVALHQGANLSIDPGDGPLKLAAQQMDIGEREDLEFLVRVLDRRVARYDTIRISTYCENGGAVVCEKVIWIEAIRGPILTLACDGPDSLTFDDATLSYMPSPFPVYLTATNTGTAAADSVVTEYLAGPGMELVAAETAAKMLAPQRLNPAESGAAQWSIAAVPHTIANTDTIWLQTRTTSTLLEEMAPCPVAVYVPAVRNPNVRIECEAPPYVAVEGRAYLPDPLNFRVRLTNTGTAMVFDVVAAALPSARLQLTASEEAEKNIGVLAAGTGSAELEWAYHAIPSTLGDTVQVCFRVSGRFFPDMYCCAKLYLPPIPEKAGVIEITCVTPDTVRGDEVLRRYPDPVEIQSMITNTGTAEIDTVYVSLLAPAGVGFSNGETGTRTLTGLRPAETRAIAWDVDFIEDTSTVLKDRIISVRAVTETDLRYCTIQTVVVPFASKGIAAFDLVCSSPDTLRYNRTKQTMEPDPFAVTLTVVNTGLEPLTGVVALLNYPARISLKGGESPQKDVAALLLPGESADVQWMCSAVPRHTAAVVQCVIAVSTQQGIAHTCGTSTVVDGYTPGVVFEVAGGSVVGFNQTAFVPVSLANPSALSFHEFNHTLTFDHSAVSLKGVATKEALCRDWPAPKVEEDPAGVFNVHAVGEAPVSGSGVLYYLVFTGVSDEAYGPFDVITTAIDIRGPAEIDGNIVEYIDGDITTSGSCVVPLDAAEGFLLEQNNPNPFNPVTTIGYQVPELPEGVRTVLEIIDVYGRPVRTYDEGIRTGGRYTVQFNAAGLESGMYFYRLRSGTAVMVRKMVYMK